MRRRVVLRLEQRVPAPEVASLETGLSAYVDQRFELFPRRELEHRCEAAPSPVESFVSDAKRAYVTRGLDLWPQHGLALSPDWQVAVESALAEGRLSRQLRQRRPIRFYKRRMKGLCTTIHGGFSWENYYHWTIDCMPRVYALSDSRVRALGPIKLLLARELGDDHDALLRALIPDNVEIVRVAPNTLIRPERLLVLPCLAGDNSAYLPPEYLSFIRERALGHFGITPSATRRRVYVSRAGATTRRMKNEPELVAVLERHGFVRYQLEKLSLPEQMQLFADAEIVTGPDGAGYANLIYSEDCFLCELFAHHKVQPHYRRMMAAFEQAGRKIRYAALPGDSPTRNGDFTVNVDEVVKFLGLGPSR